MFDLTKTHTIKTQTPNFWRSAAVPLALLALSITPTILKAQSVSLANLTVLKTGPIQPVGLAADSKGDVFISDYNSLNIVEVLPDGETKIVVNPAASGFAPYYLAVDAGGNLFISDPDNGRVVKLTQDGVQSIVTTGLNYPMGIAVDTAGNLFVSDFGVNSNRTDARALRVSPGGIQTVLAVGGLIPEKVAVDGAGNAYFVGQFSGYDYGVVEVPAQSNTGTKVYDRNDGTYLTGVGVDGNGNLFVTDELSDTGPGRLWEVPSLSGTPLIVAQGLGQPNGVAVDGLGNVFVQDASGAALKLQTSLNFDRVNVCSAGQTTSCSSTLPLIYNVTAAGTLGVPKMASAGLPNSEFAIASGTTCQGTLSSGEQCTVNVTFTPRTPGLGRDAVRLMDANGNVLLTTYVYGQGVGSQLGFDPGAGSTFASVSTPYGMAFDIAGNLYVANTSGHSVLKMSPNGTTSAIVTGLSEPSGVAVDAVGNVFIADMGNSSIVEVPGNGGPQTTIASGLSSPQNLAVDGGGNLYIADTFNDRVLKVTSEGIETIGSAPVGSEAGTQWWRPSAIAIDASGNIYVAQSGPQILKIALNGARTQVGNNLNQPVGLAVDAAGNLYVAQSGEAGVVQIAPDGSQTTLASTYGVLNGVAVDASGDLFFSKASSNFTQNAVVKWQRSQATSLNFATPQAAGTVSAPLQVTVENIGNAPLGLISPAMPANFEQVPGSGEPADCTANESLAPATNCNISISFAPTATGSFTGAFAVTSGASSAQKVSLGGTGSLSPQTIHFDPTTLFTTPYSPVQGSVYTLDATATSGLPVYYILMTTSVCSGSGSTLQFVHGGTCTLTAYQPGNKEYQPATSVTVSFYVYYSQTIIFNAFGTVPIVGTSFALNGTSPTYGASGIPITFTSLTPSTCSLSGAVAQAIAPGTCTIQANQAGNAQYAPAPPVPVNFTITAAQ